MRFLLDTTALSELTKRNPNAGFMNWIRGRETEDACISTISIAELVLGIELLEPSNRRKRLEEWLSELEREFQDRMLVFDMQCARAWANLVVQARRQKRVLPIVDSQIAAIAIAHGLTVVTRNIKDFTILGCDNLRVLDPWS